MPNLSCLIALPRTSSTAFESSMLARNDFEVYHEPWCLWYYTNKGFTVPERYQPKFFQENKDDKHQFFKNLLEDSTKSNIFVKDFSYNLFDILSKFSETSAEPLAPDIKFVFLMRHPRTTTLSFHKTATDAHVEVLDFMEEQLNYEVLLKTYELCWQLTKEQPLLIEAEHLGEIPEQVIHRYCEYTKIDFKEVMLKWPSKEENLPFAWEIGRNWHQETIKSTGFKPLRSDNPDYYNGLPKQEQERIEKLTNQQLPFYEQLRIYSSTADLVPTTVHKENGQINSSSLSALHSAQGLVAHIGKQGNDKTREKLPENTDEDEVEHHQSIKTICV